MKKTIFILSIFFLVSPLVSFAEQVPLNDSINFKNSNSVFSTSYSSLVFKTAYEWSTYPEQPQYVSIEKVGNYAIRFSYYNNAIYDISDAGNPQYIGTVSVQETDQINSTENLKFGKGLQNSLWVHDFSGLPDTISYKKYDSITTTGSPYLSGTNLFVPNDHQVNVYDISDPNAPELIVTYTNDDIWFRDIYAEGNILYILVNKTDYSLSDNSDGFVVMDIKNLNNIELDGIYNGKISELCSVRNSYVYIIDDGSLKIIDATNKGDIKQIGASSDSVGANFFKLKGDYAFFLKNKYKGNFTEILALNIKDPSNIYLQGDFIPAYGLIFLYADIIGDNYLYLAGFDNIEPCMGLGCPGLPDVQGYLNVYKIEGMKQAKDVQLSSASAKVKKNKVIVEWETKDEKNIKQFMMVKKINKISGSESSHKNTFSKKTIFKKIVPKGDGSSGATYKVIDKKIKKDSVYQYDLKYRDLSGQDHLLKSLKVSIPE